MRNRSKSLSLKLKQLALLSLATLILIPANAQMMGKDERVKPPKGLTKRQKTAWMRENDPVYIEKYKKMNAENMWKLKRPDPVEPIVDDRSHKQAPSEVIAAAREIDRIIYAKLQEEGKAFNPLTSDNEFVRRIYVHIAGRIPTEDEVREFLAEKASNKRQKLIDDLLLRADYRMSMFNWFTDMLRTREHHALVGPSSGYQAWIMRQLATNRSWDGIVYDLIAAEGNLVTNPEVGWLLRDKGMKLDHVSNTLTTFLGADIACAQCHDHPKADWTQKQFLELAAFYGPMSSPKYGAKGLGPEARSGKNTVAPSLSYVYNDMEQQLTYPEDYAYHDANPGDRVVPRFPVFQHLMGHADYDDPKHQRRAFAYWLANKRNGQFAAAIVNRLWKKAFGRAIIEPVTAIDNLDNAVNAELLINIRMLMFNLDYDLMAFQRVMYNTRAFQSQSSLTPPEGEVFQFPGPIMRRLSAEESWDSLGVLADGLRVNNYERNRLGEMQAYDLFKPGSLVGVGKHNKEWHMELFNAADKVRLQWRGHNSKQGSKKSKQESVGQVKLKFKRASELKIPESPNHFLRMFGQSARELADDGTTEGGVPQTLMLMNGDADDFFGDHTSYFYRNAAAHETFEDKLDSLYMAFLSREPTSDEVAILEDSNMPIADIAWILMNTREFMFLL